jgi:hypothetical protein
MRSLAMVMSDIITIEADVFHHRDMTRPLPPFTALPGIEIRVASLEEIIELADLRRHEAGDEMHAEYRDRWHRGQKCFVARSGGRVIGGNWLALGFDYEGPVRIDLAEGEWLSIDGYTALAHRGRSIHRALHHATLVWAKAAGYRVGYTFARYRDPFGEHLMRQMEWEPTKGPHYVIISSPLLKRRFGVRHELVLHTTRSSHPVRRGPLLRIPRPDQDEVRARATE